MTEYSLVIDDKQLEEMREDPRIEIREINDSEYGASGILKDVRISIHSDLSYYQSETASTAVYPSELAIPYLSLGLVGEAGETAEKVKKTIRDDATVSYGMMLGEVGEDIERKIKNSDDFNIEDELGDVMWYVARLADELDIDLAEVADKNLDKLFDRKKRDQLHGSGDDR